MTNFPGNDGTNRAVAALMFMTSGMNTLDAYSTLNSSPWTAENMGGDAEKAASCREYVGHAVVYSMFYAIASGYISGSIWPVIGASVNNLYLVYLYERAIRRGIKSHTGGWGGKRGEGLRLGSALYWKGAS